MKPSNRVDIVVRLLDRGNIMGSIYIVLDTAMCMLWIVTYTLVLIGTVKYRYPLISPMAQAIIAPFEFSAVILFSKLSSEFNYAFAAYLYWALVEIAIIIVILKIGFIKKKYIGLYVGFVVIVTAAMIDLVAIRGYMFFFSYFNTFVGMLFWFIFILKRDYPIKPIALAVFVVKFIADVLGAIVYFGNSVWLTNMFCILLPILDIVFIPIYFRRVWQRNVDLKIK